MSDFCQQQNEQIYALNTRITTLVNNCNIQEHQTKETIIIMVPQHTLKFHEAMDWIRLQDRTQLTYLALLQYCKTLEQHCKQFQKAQLRGHAELTTFSAATSTTYSVHKDATTTTHILCTRCGYNPPQGNCPASKRNAITDAEQAISQPFAYDEEALGTPGTVTDKAGPNKEGPAAADEAVIPTAEAGSPTKGATATVLPLHANHPTAQTDSGEALH